MDNYKINHELNEYNRIEGIEFIGLMPKFLDAVGMTIGTSDKSSKLFEFHPAGGDSIETVDTDEIMNQSENSEDDEEDDNGKSSGSTSGETIVEKDATYYYIWNRETYDAALTEAPLVSYYNDHPEEDCYNEAEQRPANYNDRKYSGLIDGVERFGTASWATDSAQLITLDDNSQYYAPIFYGFDPQTVELFNDEALQDSVGKSFEITKIYYNDNCPHSWDGVNKDAFPWIAVGLPKPFNGTVKFIYDETPVEREITTEHGYYIEQVASLFGSEYKLDENEETTFDINLLDVKLITEK